MNKKDLRKFAELIVKVGANVQKNQYVRIVSNVSDEYFTKYVIEECYKAKAKMVEVSWYSDEAEKIIYKKSSTKALEEVPSWKVERQKYYRDTLPASIFIDSSDPDALSSVSPKKFVAVQRAYGKLIKPIRDEMENKYQWTIAAIPSPKWAKKVFPNESKSEAMKKLWDAIFKCTRVYGDPIKNWKEHNAYLKEKCDKLNGLGLKTLYYKSSNGTDFSVGMLKDLQFMGGGSYTTSGIYYNPNMPTEECFTSPDPKSANGTVYASKPLSLNGKVIKDFGFKFENGKVVEIYAKDSETKKALNEHISTDEGASMLGEVALVPFDSPINITGLLFSNTLFDENACCHLALGAGFEDCVKDFEKKTKEELKACGINDSIIHTDFMIGTKDLSIIAELKDGKKVQIFKDGTWAI